MRSARFIVGILVLGLIAVACNPEPARDEAGAIQEEGDLSVFKFRIGDCFNDPSTESEQISDVDAVPCSEAHDNEVFYLFNLPDGDYPSESSVEEAVVAECLPAYETYVGTAYEVSELFFFPLTPTEDSWELQSDREVVCSLYEDGAQLVGSMKGSGR